MSTSDATGPEGETPAAAEPDAPPAELLPAAQLPPGHVFDNMTGQPRPMTFMERARQAAGQAAVAAAKVSVDVGSQAAKAAADVGSQAAKAGADLSGRAAHATATYARDPATKARAQAALKKAKRGFTTVLERIDPRILADVVVKATSLQEKANASLKERGSAYRIGEIAIGASFPPSIQFSIERVDDPHHELHDSTVLLAKVIEESGQSSGVAPATIVGLDGTAINDADLDELDDDD